MKTVRHVDEMGAKDVAVGQVWLRATAPSHERVDWTIESIDAHGQIALRRGEATAAVSIGHLLSDWVLTAEAP